MGNDYHRRITSYNVCYTKLLRDLEYQLARLDSGCGLFMQEGGQWYVVSIGDLVGDHNTDGDCSSTGWPRG